jgi:hypothetical protein
MKRHFVAAIMAVLFALAAVGTASASGLGSPLSSQTNSSDQGQVQVVPIAPQANVQNVNVGGGNAGNNETRTLNGGGQGDIEQGNANNANTGQASQQQNTVVGGSGGTNTKSHPSTAPSKTSCGCPRKPSSHTSSKSTTDQSNHSDQSQVQIVPIAPQLNVQNVNVGNQGDVEQGNANNANTGQANQQENTHRSGFGGREQDGSWSKGGRCEKGCASPSHKSSGGSTSARQSNWSDQEQIQIVPIAPQLNVQNVNVATFGDVEQGNANNANTGQASQQQNTVVGSQRTSAPNKVHSRGRGCNDSCGRPKCDPCGPKRPANRCEPKKRPTAHGRPATVSQRNSSKQEQVQVVPIAPQANVQNANVGGGRGAPASVVDGGGEGRITQGNANNANTGQASQQENSVVPAERFERRGEPAPPPVLI